MKVVKDILKWVNDQCQIRLSSTELTTISDGTELIFTPQYIDGVENPLFPSSYTQTIVNITINELKNLDSVAKTILPTLTGGKYYEYYGWIEHTAGNSDLEVTGLQIGVFDGTTLLEGTKVNSDLIYQGVGNGYVRFGNNVVTNPELVRGVYQLNSPIELKVVAPESITDYGTSTNTLRIVIYSKERTFGA